MRTNENFWNKTWGMVAVSMGGAVRQAGSLKCSPIAHSSHTWSLKTDLSELNEPPTLNCRPEDGRRKSQDNAQHRLTYNNDETTTARMKTTKMKRPALHVHPGAPGTAEVLADSKANEAPGVAAFWLQG